MNAYIINKNLYIDLTTQSFAFAEDINNSKTCTFLKHDNVINETKILTSPLKNLRGGSLTYLQNHDIRNDFYFTHSVAGGAKTLYTILKDGYLRPGKDVNHANILSTGELKHIYGNINFSDLNNVDIIGNVSLQFSPE
jgi:hypothetical protein